MEEELLILEDSRIDIRSDLEKASLKRTRKRNLINGSLNSSSEEYPELINDIKMKLLSAEKFVKDARREMREWFRVVRELAGSVAPELFHMLPDLQSAGSLLGDGGFAENAKLPKRKLEEYDNVRFFNNCNDDTIPADGAKEILLSNHNNNNFISPVGSSNNHNNNNNNNGSTNKNGNMNSGRHVLLRATYDGEEVVLKGFSMGEKDQRAGLERELAILAKLQNDSVIRPIAIVEDSDSCESSPYAQKVAVFVQYPYYKGGNLLNWLKNADRKPWELQGIARQLLYGLMYVHDRGITHRDIKPSNVLIHEDGWIVLSDFEFSREFKSTPGDEEFSTVIVTGTRGFMAPEVELGGRATFGSDMYSYGVLLLFMHYPNLATSFIPGNLHLPLGCESELSDLIGRLLSINQSQRPTAAAALMHPYFRSTFIERLLQEGEFVAQDRKLEAVRDLLHRVRLENRTNIEKTTVSRENLTEILLQYFQDMPLEKMRASLKIIFTGEPGVDEGGLLTEMFTIFFESVFSGYGGLFEGSGEREGGMKSDGNMDDSETKVINHIVLPSSIDISSDRMQKLRAFGRAMVKALYEGRRIGNRLCPSVFKFLSGTNPTMRDLQMYDHQTARSMQWTLATVGVEEYGMHFESVGESDMGYVNDSNKATFVKMKIENILVKSRIPHLVAIKTGEINIFSILILIFMIHHLFFIYIYTSMSTLDYFSINTSVYLI